MLLRMLGKIAKPGKVRGWMSEPLLLEQLTKSSQAYQRGGRSTLETMEYHKRRIGLFLECVFWGSGGSGAAVGLLEKSATLLTTLIVLGPDRQFRAGLFEALKHVRENAETRKHK